MFLSVAPTHEPASDLGFLLHKHPDRLHQVELGFGNAWLFYPEATDARCEAAIPLEAVVTPLPMRGGEPLVRALFEPLGWRVELSPVEGADPAIPSKLYGRLRLTGEARLGALLREFALGLEGLKRFVAREPLRRVHQCVFAVLALESEPIDPRL